MTNFNFLKQQTQDFNTINNIRDLVEDNHGNIWFTHGNQSELFLPKLDGRHFQSYNIGQQRFVSINLIDSKGRVWLTSQGQNNNYNLLTFDGKSLVKLASSSRLGCNYLSSIFEDHSGNIWIGSENGLFRYNNNS